MWQGRRLKRLRSAGCVGRKLEPHLRLANYFVRLSQAAPSSERSVRKRTPQNSERSFVSGPAFSMHLGGVLISPLAQWVRNKNTYPRARRVFGPEVSEIGCEGRRSAWQCCGASVSWWPGSACGDPIVNDPAGMTTISGQSAQSLKDECPGLSSCSLAPAGMSKSEATESVSISPKSGFMNFSCAAI